MDIVSYLMGKAAGGGSPTPPPEAPDNDVNFIDYDGRIVYSYSAADFLALTELPENPTHEGLTAQGWNWTLENAQTFVAETGMLDIGQSYITDDGKTRLFISLDETSLSPHFGPCVNGSVVIDWGDGSELETVTGTSVTSAKDIPHTYSTPGDYVITMDVTGTAGFTGDSSTGASVLWNGINAGSQNYRMALKHVELGENVVELRSYAFSGCGCLKTITIPKEVYAASNSKVNNGLFDNCYSLSALVFPSGLKTSSLTAKNAYSLIRLCYPDTMIGNNTNVCSGCTSLRRVISKISITGSAAYQNCSSLREIATSSSVATIGTQAFQFCTGLKKVRLYEGLNAISTRAFEGCMSLTEITIPSTVTSMGQNMFAYCSKLESARFLNSPTSIPTNMFYECTSLTNVTIPDSVTSIAENAFIKCRSLVSLTIPANVTSIGNAAINEVSSLQEIHFKSTTPPTLASANAVSPPTTCKIYVPAGTLSAYTSAANYPSASTYTYVEE